MSAGIFALIYLATARSLRFCVQAVRDSSNSSVLAEHV